MDYRWLALFWIFLSEAAAQFAYTSIGNIAYDEARVGNQKFLRLFKSAYLQGGQHVIFSDNERNLIIVRAVESGGFITADKILKTPMCTSPTSKKLII